MGCGSWMRADGNSFYGYLAMTNPLRKAIYAEASLAKLIEEAVCFMMEQSPPYIRSLAWINATAGSLESPTPSGSGRRPKTLVNKTFGSSDKPDCVTRP